MDINSRITSIFKNSLSENKNDQLTTNLRENDQIEFKKSIHISSDCLSKDYLKTICAFANNKGGVIIFGVHPTNYSLVGIKNKFHELDNRYASTLIKEHVHGSFDFDLFTQGFKNSVVGFLTIGTAHKKPVMVKDRYQIDGEAIVSGDIFFRYPGQDRKIDFNDLVDLIDLEVRTRHKKLTEKLRTIISLGPDSVDLLDNKTGELLLGNEHTKLVLDKNILDKLNLIREGQIVNKEGAPAYVIKGNIDSEDVIRVQSGAKQGIRDTDLFESFFTQNCENPITYITEVLYKPSYYFPVFFWGSLSGKKKEEVINTIQKYEDTSVRKHTKNQLVLHIKNGYKDSIGSIINEINDKEVIESNNTIELVEDLMQKYNIKGFNRHKSVARTIAMILLKNGHEVNDGFIESYLKEVIESITHLSQKQVVDNEKLLFNILPKLFEKVQSLNSSPEISKFRKAICYTDYQLYFSKWS